LKRRRPDIRSLSFAAFVAAFLAIPGAGLHAEPSPRRFLVIYEFHSSLVANIEIAQGIEERLAEALPTEREIYSVYLDSARFPSNRSSAHFLGQLEDNFSGMSFDAVLAIGPAALTFALENRGHLAPDAPIVFTGIAGDKINEADLPPDVGGVYRSYDMAQIVKFAMELQPEARQIVVMSGTAGFDRTLAERAREALGSRFAGLPVSHVSDLPLAGYVEAARGYDSDTILLVLTILRDATGRAMLPVDAAEAIAAVSAAPTYGFHSTFLQAGVTAGHVTTFPDIGRLLADQALDAIEVGGRTRLPVTEAPATNVVNWPQLIRFGIDTNLVPPDTMRMFYTTPVWQRYRREIALALTVLLLQSATIAALVVQMRRRNRAAQELEAGRLALTHAARSSQLGQLSGAIAHELNQPLTAILSNAEAGARLLDAEPPDLAEISEILTDIAEDDRRAANIIVQLRRLMKEGDVEFEQIDLNEVVSETLGLSHSELVARQTDVEFRRGKEQVPVLGNFTQLQQVVLNLLLNAADAMRDLAPGQRHVLFETRILADGTRQLAVSDNGPGLSAESASDAFKPFVTSRPDGLGLGLSICRSIAKAHGGTLAFQHDVESGARIILALPEP
jgi:signal transduction histidine kinase